MEHNREVLDVVSGGVSLAHNAHGVCNPAKDTASPWWLDMTTVGQMVSPHDSRENSETTLTSFTHSFHLALSPRWRPRQVRRHLPISTRSHSFTPHGPPSLDQFPHFPSYPPPPKGVPTSTLRKFRQSNPTSGYHTDFCHRVYPPGFLLPPHFDALLMDRKDQMVLGDFNSHHPSWFSRTGDDRAAARGEAQLAARCCESRPSYSPPLPRPALLSRYHPSICKDIFFPIWRGPPLLSLDLTISP